ncbi:MAG TPA: metal ABC transporter ATP-binding protein [Candidatus Kapabacteria bacterium]|nr:metal ABC transporter ATP-binding protein [Candidatus Kapabacteria bacterium]
MSVTQDEQCIVVKDLSYSYHHDTVLNDVSFSIPYGDYVGLIGPNGGGKTTLLKILLGILPKQKGEITLFGKKSSVNGVRNDIGYVPQRVATEVQLFPATVEEVVKSGRTPGRSLVLPWGKTDQKAVEDAYMKTDIHHLRNRRIGDLSGGERQRVFIARALAGEPKLLILDEPTVGVDITTRERFAAFLGQLNTDHGLTILLVSHDIDAIAKDVKHVLCLNRSLVCHLCSEDFVKDDYLQKVYGSKATSIHHHDH